MHSVITTSPRLPFRQLFEGYRLNWFWYPVLQTLEKLFLLLLFLFLQPVTSTTTVLILATIILTATAVLSFLSVFIDPVEAVVDRCCRYGCLYASTVVTGGGGRPSACSDALSHGDKQSGCACLCHRVVNVVNAVMCLVVEQIGTANGAAVTGIMCIANGAAVISLAASITNGLIT